MNLGIDFGSTYSTVSRYLSSYDRVEALTLMEGESSSIPSAVSISRSGTIMCGSSAKDKIGRADVYETFKMLLVETNCDMIHKRGYSDKRSPYFITKCFLENIINGMANRYSNPDEDIDSVVVCVPEVWCNNLKTLDGRIILRKIIKEELNLGTRKVKEVKVITEPEAASAFFAYNYERETKQRFNGHLLLIDYGGGTLDITLTEVFSDGNRMMEIGYRDSGGAGENHPDSEGNCQIGDAGFAYIQQVTALAIRESGMFDNEVLDFNSRDFKIAMHDFEKLLKDPIRSNDLQNYFGMLGSEYDDFKDVLDEPATRFGDIYFMGEEIEVTYQQIYIAYRDTIEGVLKKQLDKMNEKVKTYINNDPCSVESGKLNNFKIALVGGFSSFFLVQQQIYSIYNFNVSPEHDLRLKNINADKCEQAISLGAALIASERVIPQKTARYSIGLYTHNGSRMRLAYGINYHQQIEPGVPYFMLIDRTKPDVYENRVKYGALSTNIRDFVVEFSPNQNRGFKLVLKEDLRRKLESVPEGGIWCCGFSMDENEVVSFHFEPVPGMDPRYKSDYIRLDSYSNMFELTSGDEVWVDEA